MGKKKSSGNRGGGGGGNGGGEEDVVVVAREFVLKVAMHCRCHGCTDKVRAAVRDVTQAPGVEAFDSSAAESSGEVRLLATADPERLRRRLRRATGKKVDLLLPREPAAGSKEQRSGGGKKGDPLADAAELQALLASLQLQQGPVARQQYGGGQGAAAAWAANHQQQQLMGLGLGSGWNGAGAGGYGAAYPWLSSPASSCYPAAPAPSLGAYAYPLPAPAPAHGLGNLGYYYGGGGAPAWHGY